MREQQLRVGLLILVSVFLQEIHTLESCASIPFNFITPCVSTCESCGSQGNRNQCGTCPDYLELNEDTLACGAPTGMTYYTSSYFMEDRIEDSDDLGRFNTANGLTTIDDVATFCIARNYRFQILGRFPASIGLIWKEKYSLEVDKIALNFRLYIQISKATLNIEINNQVVYEQHFDPKSQFGDNAQANTNVVPTEIVVENDVTPYLDTVFIPISTGMIELNSFSAQITIRVKSTDESVGPYWGVSELVVMGRKCQVCVAEATRELIRILGIIIGISAGVVMILVIILVIINIIKEINHRMKMKDRVKALLREKTESVIEGKKGKGDAEEKKRFSQAGELGEKIGQA